MEVITDIGSKKFFFVGNRGFVLTAMDRIGLKINNIAATKGSFLARQLADQDRPHIVIDSRSHLINLIKNTNFDILISNGCPYILPISELQTQNQLYVNIHPSYLPDLRGCDPVPGALLHKRDAGATCHHMDDGIDSGEIISQIKIPFSKDLDAPLLYQLSFIAEKEVFNMACEKKFLPTKKQIATKKTIYYTKVEKDLNLSLSKSADEAISKIKAFNNKSQGSFFYFKNIKFNVYDAEIIENEFILDKINSYNNGEVILVYENNILFKKWDSIIKLKNLSGDLQKIKIGDNLF